MAWQGLTDVFAWSLVGALWKGMVLWAVRCAVDPLLPVRAVRLRYAATAGAFFGIPLWWSLSLLHEFQAPVHPSPTAAPASASSVAAVLIGLWIAGVAISTVRVGGGLWRWHRIVRRATTVSDGWKRRFATLADRAGVGAPVRLLASKTIDLPCVYGWIRPVVLVPGSLLTRLDPDQLEALLLHELVHVRRWDWMVGLLQAAVESLLFHVPFVWMLSTRLRAEREHCCDDTVVDLLGDRHAYASALVSLEHAVGVPRWVPSAHGGSLIMRIRRLARPHQRSRASVVFALMLLTATVGLASIVTLTADDSEIPSWVPADVRRWEPLLEEAAEAHDLPPALLAMMTLVESGGDPEARSPLGAAGLMQIMPSTAERIAEQRGLEGLDLLDPATNLDLGAWYMARQLQAFDGQLEAALAAYNGGPERARRWLEDGRALSEETEGYVALLSGMWQERAAQQSRTYSAWRKGRTGDRLTAWNHPLPSGRMTQIFGNRNHRGVDLAAPTGTPVTAPLPGAVIAVSDDEKRGKSVVVRHGIGLETRYDHLDSIGVAVGDRLASGQPLGTVGSTGVSTGPHLHFEVREDGTPVDPMAYIGASVPMSD